MLVHYWAGSYREAEGYGQQGRQLAEAIRSGEGTMRSGSDLGMVLAGLGRHEEALDLMDEAIARGRELELPARWVSRGINMSAGALRELFEVREARRRNEEAREMGAASGVVMAEVQAGIDLAFLDLLAGEPGRAEAALPGRMDRAAGAE